MCLQGHYRLTHLLHQLPRLSQRPFRHPEIPKKECAGDKFYKTEIKMVVHLGINFKYIFLD